MTTYMHVVYVNSLITAAFAILEDAVAFTARKKALNPDDKIEMKEQVMVQVTPCPSPT